MHNQTQYQSNPLQDSLDIQFSEINLINSTSYAAELNTSKLKLSNKYEQRITKSKLWHNPSMAELISAIKS